MFARFKNLFSKNKSESEEANIHAESASASRASFEKNSVNGNEISNADPSSKLEGLNLLKTIVENEQHVITKANQASTSLSEEVAELLKRRLSQEYDLNNIEVELSEENLGSDKISFNHANDEKKLEEEPTEPINSDFCEESKESLPTLQDNEEIPMDRNENMPEEVPQTESESPYLKISSQNTTDNEAQNIIESKDNNESDQISLENNSDNEKMETNSETQFDNKLDLNVNEAVSLNDEAITNDVLKTPENPLSFSHHNSITQENGGHSTTLSHENSPADLTESSKSLSQSSVKENCNKSLIENSSSSSAEINISPTNNSSIVVEDIPSEINTASPTVDSTISGSSGSNTSTLDTATVNEIIDPSKIIVNPIDNNGLACTSITNKLTDIAEVAEALDAVIREVQENVQSVELESNPSPSDKKMGTLRSTSSEDWHSRSTEDDSFATASEGNFTPHSHSSASFQTASGRTSSFISCDKNSFDASEADDSTFAFEMPELTSPHNMSFEGSEQSYLSAQPTINDEDKEKTPTKLSESSSQTAQQLEEDQSSIADIEDLHSESVTPTPAETIEEYLGDSIPIESETELEMAGIADAPTMEILTEHSALPMSRTPEVSLSNSNSHANMNSNNEARDSTEQETENTNTNNKPNAAWRRSKYYENITKQTIKGFL